MAGEVEFRHEALPPPEELEREWRALETIARPSFFTSWHWIGTLLVATPVTRRPSLLRGVARGVTVALALLGAGVTRRRHGMIRSRGVYLNETGDPCFDALTIEHNGILAAAGREAAALDAALAWFAGNELYLSGSFLRPPEQAVEGRGLGRSETTLPSYSVDLGLLSPSGGELYPVLSANAHQQLRRAFRQFERTGPLRLSEATTAAEALDFFAALRTLHCAWWERRGRPHAFSRAFFEPFHRLLIERSFAGAGRGSSEPPPATGSSAISTIFSWETGFMPIRAGLPTPIGESGPASSPMRWPSGMRSGRGPQSMISWPGITA